ncbi:MAG: cupin [Verrucomicrobia bacterium]|nr:cupin [Verrucomicrobiota bacterium]
MKDIEIDREPGEEELDKLGVRGWPIWEKEVSEFPWSYDEVETCYILRGEATVTPENGKPVQIRAGEFVTFPGGMSCTWKITKDIRKHYKFG